MHVGPIPFFTPLRMLKERKSKVCRTYLG